MALQRCSLCFQLREPAKRDVLPGVAICGRCAMDVERILGYLAANGHGLALDMFVEAKILDLNTGEILQAPPLLGHAAAPPKPPDEPRTGSVDPEPESQAKSKPK